MTELEFHRQVWVCKREIFEDGCVDSTDWHYSEEEARKCEAKNGENGSENRGDPIE